MALSVWRVRTRCRILEGPEAGKDRGCEFLILSRSAHAPAIAEYLHASMWWSEGARKSKVVVTDRERVDRGFMRDGFFVMVERTWAMDRNEGRREGGGS